MCRPPAIAVFVAILVMALLVGACGPTSAPSRSPASAPTSASPAGVAPTSSPVVADPTGRPGEPPSAALAAEGGDPVIGQLGTFTWGEAGSDSPWLPGAPIRVGAGEGLTMTLTDGVTTAAWSVRRTGADQVAAPQPLPMADAAGGPVTFVVPPPGRWSVEVVVQFSGAGAGSASYFWLVTVD